MKDIERTSNESDIWKVVGIHREIKASTKETHEFITSISNCLGHKNTPNNIWHCLENIQHCCKTPETSVRIIE